MRFLPAFLFLLFTMQPAFAEGPNRSRVYQPPRRDLRVKKPQRQLASRSAGRSGFQVKVAYEDEEPAVSLRFGLVGGLSLVSNQTLTNGLSAEKASGQTPNLGLLLDLTLWQYLGLDIDGYYALGGELKNESGGTSAASSYGGFFNLKLQYPIAMSGVRFTPRAGVGYAYAQAKTATALNGDFNSTFSGPYGSIGFEFEPVVNWFLLADYAQTFSASGQVASDLGSSEQEFSTAKLERIRASVLYRVVPRFLVGGQFIRRAYSYGYATAGTDITGKLEQNQVLGVFLYEM